MTKKEIVEGGGHWKEVNTKYIHSVNNMWQSVCHTHSAVFFNQSIKARTTVLPGTTATVFEDLLVRTI